MPSEGVISHTSVRGRHFSAAIVRRYHPETGRPQLLVVDVTPTTGNDAGKTATKFPGGTDKGHPGESKEETRDRECLEETGLTSVAFTLVWLDEKRFPRYFYFVEFDKCGGELRTEPFTDEDGDNIALRWVDVEKLGGELFPSHQDAFAWYVRNFGIR